MARKVMNYEQVESLSALGVSLRSIAHIIGWSESAFFNHRGKDKKLDVAIERGRSHMDASISQALMNRACGPSLHEVNPEKRMHEIGIMGGDTKCFIYIDRKMTGPQVHKIQISGDPNGGPVKTWVEIMEKVTHEEEEQGKKPKIPPL